MKKVFVRAALTVLGFLFSWNGSYAEEGGIVTDFTNFLMSVKPGQYLTYHDAFNINLFQLYLEKTPTTEGGVGDLLGFSLKIDLGKDTEVFRVVRPGGRESGIRYDLSSSDTDLFRVIGIGGDEYDFQEAYFHAIAPVGKGIDIYVGKFFTLAGADVMESKDSYNFSPSLLFDFAIPITLTGLRLHYGKGPLDFTVGVNNGWNPWQAQDIYNGKAIEARIGLTHGNFSLGVVDLVGSDKSNLDNHLRNDLDFVATVAPTKKLNLVANFDYGLEQKITNAHLGLVDKNVQWWGIGG